MCVLKYIMKTVIKDLSLLNEYATLCGIDAEFNRNLFFHMFEGIVHNPDFKMKNRPILDFHINEYIKNFMFVTITSKVELYILTIKNVNKLPRVQYKTRFMSYNFTNKTNVMDMTRIKKAYSLVGLQLLYFIS